MPLDSGCTIYPSLFSRSQGDGTSVGIEDFRRAITAVSRHELILDGERTIRQSRLRRIRTHSMDEYRAAVVTPSSTPNFAEETSQHPRSAEDSLPQLIAEVGPRAVMRRFTSSVLRRRKTGQTRRNSRLSAPAPSSPRGGGVVGHDQPRLAKAPVCSNGRPQGVASKSRPVDTPVAQESVV